MIIDKWTKSTLFIMTINNDYKQLPPNLVRYIFFSSKMKEVIHTEESGLSTLPGSYAILNHEKRPLYTWILVKLAKQNKKVL